MTNCSFAQGYVHINLCAWNEFRRVLKVLGEWYILYIFRTMRWLFVCTACRNANGNVNRWINKFNSTLVYHRIGSVVNITKRYNCDTVISMYFFSRRWYVIWLHLAVAILLLRLSIVKAAATFLLLFKSVELPILAEQYSWHSCCIYSQFSWYKTVFFLINGNRIYKQFNQPTGTSLWA